jgi:ribosome biogenesis protein BMS1
VYAPFSGVGGIVYDKDAVYIELGGSHSHNRKQREVNQTEDAYNKVYSNNSYLNSIIGTQNTIDSKLTVGKLKLFSGDSNNADYSQLLGNETSNKRKAIENADSEDENDDDEDNEEESEGDDDEEEEDDDDG